MIKQLQLLNFRNLAQLNCQFTKNLTVFFGKNGAGKTNIVEAIYYLSNLRSFRPVSDKQLIKNDKDYSRINALIHNDTQEQLSIFLFNKGKHLVLNQQAIHKSSEFIGQLNAILFAPNDLIFFDDSPKVRRKFLDLELSKISTNYVTHLNTFNKLLKERNLALKNKVDVDFLEILNQQLVLAQYELYYQRYHLLSHFQEKINQLFNSLSQKTFKISLKYNSDGQSLKKETFCRLLLEKMAKSVERDLLFNITHHGLHRDDFQIYLDDISLVQIASQGQKRLILIALKMALVDYIMTNKQIKPVLLLDDVLSELDDYHQLKLIKLCQSLQTQTFITTTDIKTIPLAGLDAQYYQVAEGKIIQKG